MNACLPKLDYKNNHSQYNYLYDSLTVELEC